MAVRVLLKTWLEELEDARGLRVEAFKTTRTWLIQLQSTRGLVVRASLGPQLLVGTGPVQTACLGLLYRWAAVLISGADYSNYSVDHVQDGVYDKDYSWRRTIVGKLMCNRLDYSRRTRIVLFS